LLNVAPEQIKNHADIPFLPIGFFKSHSILAPNTTAELKFLSSGTTTSTRSTHYVADADLYRSALLTGFRRVYGNPSEWSFLALLPSYLENSHSSLIHMVNVLMEESPEKPHGFFMNNTAELAAQLDINAAHHTKTMLIGVSYALLDFAEEFPRKSGPDVVMETGGMKGRRKELVRSELHYIIKAGLGVQAVHSEYGMTELLSQAYAPSDGLFTTPPWMKVMIRDVRDPRSWVPPGKTGGVNIIDLANLHSCSFIETSDLGRLHDDGSFEILGRFDHAEIRGCNLLAF
ncbi:MAG: acyl transferase, partial [Flavobacteriales bacterium]|nr:acyl transferase [Flavobacteriales bacterium]